VTPEEVSGAVTVPSTTDAFPPHVLREYALIADGERGALIGPRGDIVWMCAPRWHSDAVFAALIGGDGAYAVTPEDRFVRSCSADS
jgi:alpha,alpha-trehalase